jgi:4-amino-4-deoxy-L-arabinose transferase-like glycosyltransferase
MPRRILWSLAAILLTLAVYGVVTSGLLRQPIWSEAGLHRLLWFTAGYWVLAITTGRFFPSLATLAAIAYAAVSVGPLPVAAVVLLLAAAYGVGSRVIPDHGVQTLALGVAMYALITGLLARFAINTPLLYLLLAAAGVAIGARNILGAARSLPLRSGSRWLTFALYPAWIHLLGALFPETSSDGLAMHLTVPAWIAAHREWHFDPEYFSWALMPMSGDWAHTAAYMLGGEAAARLLNLSLLLTLAALIYTLAGRVVSYSFAAIAAVLFLSTPVAYLVTGSLFIENFWTLMVCATFATVVSFRETGDRRTLVAAGLLAGAAMSGKLLAVPLIGLIAVCASIEVARNRRTALRSALAALVLALVLGLPPYLEAWTKTGNPVFPSFNSLFRSPLFAADLASTDPRYPPALGWRWLWDATFHSARFLEGHNGSLGFHYWLLLPLTLAGLRRRVPWLVLCSLAISMIWIVFVASTMSYLRYLYPALALLCVAFAWIIEELSPKHGRPAMLGLLIVIALINTYFLAASSWYTRDFALPVLDSAARSSYVAEAAPIRRLVEHWNQTARGQPVAFFDEDQPAVLVGRAFTASWRTWPFRHALDEAETPGDVLIQLRERGVRHMAGPSAKAWFAAQHAASQGLLQVCGQATLESGNAAAFTLRSECLTVEPEEIDRRYFEDAPVAPRGEHDDVSTYARYHGRWLHDRQFAEAEGHTLTYTASSGDWTQIRFNGRRIRIGYTAAFNRGTAEVILDGVALASLRQHSAETRWRSEATFDAAADGIHTVRLRHAGAGQYIDIDRFVVD